MQPTDLRHRLATGLACLLLAGCSTLIPTPDDFPPPPVTPIVEFPTPSHAPTVTPPPRTRTILQTDMLEARTFFLVTKTAAVAGDSSLIADRIFYPLAVRVNGQELTITSAPAFEKYYPQIFTDSFVQKLYASDENALQGYPGGVVTADGSLTFNLFCTDAACTQAGFLITAIEVQ